MPPTKIKALALFSGGLDSILACRLAADQNIEVVAIKFVTPFFGYDLLACRDDYIREVKGKYDIDVIVNDISEKYLPMLGNPAHGYGKNFNPCLDCKILMLSEARRMMKGLGASFIITGEVVGQRPMSQRLDTLGLIARESGCEDFLVRPLCAGNIKISKSEKDGLIDRERLLKFRGRDRNPQMELAERFGISDYPNPGGGCVLTDRNLGKRIAWFYGERDRIKPDDLLLLLLGRNFRLPTGGWLVMGRNEVQNEKVSALSKKGDWLLKMLDRPGPLAILRYSDSEADLRNAAGILARYARKIDGKIRPGKVLCEHGDEHVVVDAEPLPDEVFQEWQR